MTRWKAEKKVPRASRQVLVCRKDCGLYTPKRGRTEGDTGHKSHRGSGTGKGEY